MPRVITDGKPVENAYEPPPLAPQRRETSLGDGFVHALSQAIMVSFRNAIAEMPAPVINIEAPVVNVPKPEVKINSPVYVQPTEVRVPATVVNVPEGKAPVTNIEPAKVTLQTNRPSKWKFIFNRDELGRITTVDAEAK